VSGCQIFNLVWSAESCYAIVQGSTFNWLTFLYPSDVTAWTPRGQIRQNYADLDATVDATFSFPALTYGTYTINGVTSNYTAIKPQLTATETQNLTASKPGIVTVDGAYVTIIGVDGNEKKATIGKDIWVYDVDIQSPGGDVIKVGRGLVQVLQEVTRNA